jgi:hypothetical protein
MKSDTSETNTPPAPSGALRDRAGKVWAKHSSLHGLVYAAGLVVALVGLGLIAQVPAADKDRLDAYSLICTYLSALALADGVIRRYGSVVRSLLGGGFLLVVGGVLLELVGSLRDPDLGDVAIAAVATGGIAWVVDRVAHCVGKRWKPREELFAGLLTALGLALLTLALLLQLRKTLYAV